MDYITDKDGNKRDKKTGQIIGSTQTTTIEPSDEKSKAAKRSKANVLGDIAKAVTANQAGGLGNAGASTATPSIQQKIEDQKVINEISEQAGVPLKSMPENAPVYAEQVNDYLKDPGNYDEATAKEKAALENETEKPEMTPTEVVQPEALGNGVEPTVQSDEQSSSETVKSDEQMPKPPASKNWDYEDYINNYTAPKNGAEMLKRLWNNGAGGKAAAIGNVLGNTLGSIGKGFAGQDYQSDWNKYKENWMESEKARNEEAFKQNMDIVSDIRQNEQTRNEMQNLLNFYEQIGGSMDASKLSKIKKALTATGQSSSIDYLLYAGLGELVGDPKFQEALKNASPEVIGLLSNIAQSVGTTANVGSRVVGGLNSLFGGAQ